jgi:hypothetical protein
MFHSQAIELTGFCGFGVFFTKTPFSRDFTVRRRRGASSCTGLSTADVDKTKTLVLP